MDHQILDNDTSVEDHAIALKMAIDNSSSCKSFTHKDMLNPSQGYQYANNPGFNACSSDSMKKALTNVPSNSALSCSFISNQSSCPFYTPDYSIVLKSSITVLNSALTFYLSRFRSFNGSFVYKIYDSSGKSFFDLNYSDISNVNGQIDEEATKVFHQFLDDFSQNGQYSVENILSKNDYQQEQKNTKSYLKSLIS